MCERCAALEEEVTYLRERLGEQLDRDLQRVVMKTFHLTQGEAGVVTALHSARGALLSSYRLGDVIRADHAKDDYDGNTVQVHIMRIRRKTFPEFITTFRRVGYALSDEARLQIAEAVRHDAIASTLPLPEPLRVGAQWDARRIGRLAQLRMEGKTFSDCARRMHLSRNACISAANRYLRQDGAKPFA